jgi:inosine-uridine nucleoside N-ribohydrolase
VPPTRVVIDTDPGIDDVVALALAARSPEFDILALTTSYGNAPLAATTRNARRLLDLVGRPDIPVHPGAERPVMRPLVTAPETHGDTGVGYAPVPEATPVRPNPTVLLDLLRTSSGPVVLVTLGPLTNLAQAVRADPALVGARVATHLGMFGNLHERGNTNRWADFNAWCDPEAVEMVLAADLGTVMVGLDVTRRMTVSARDVDQYVASPDPLVAWLGGALRFYVEFHRSQERLDGCVVNDVLPIGELLRPGLLTLANRRLSVNLEEGEERGRTAEHAIGWSARVALGVDIPAMRELLERVFKTTEGETSPHVSPSPHWTQT